MYALTLLLKLRDMDSLLSIGHRVSLLAVSSLGVEIIEIIDPPKVKKN